MDEDKLNEFNFYHLINYLEENLFNENHKSIWSCCQYKIKMNMIYENRRRSASDDPFLRAFLWLLCFASLHEKCRYSEFFWSVFSRIWTEYWEIVRISPYSVEMRENTDQKTLNTDTFHELCVLTCSSVHYSISVYNVTTLKAIKKNSKYCLVCEAPLIDRVFENIFRQCFG